mgnify:CR=1 FL=1
MVVSDTMLTSRALVAADAEAVATGGDGSILAFSSFLTTGDMPSALERDPELALLKRLRRI